jgi:hypothetical protein
MPIASAIFMLQATSSYYESRGKLRGVQDKASPGVGKASAFIVGSRRHRCVAFQGFDFKQGALSGLSLLTLCFV